MKIRKVKSKMPINLLVITRKLSGGQPYSDPAAGGASGIITPQADHSFTDPAATMSSNIYPLPDSITVQIASTSTNAFTTVYLLNQDILNNVTAGSGGGSITYTYQDGFTTALGQTIAGLVTSQILTNARNGIGAICYGVAMRMNVTSSGAGDAAGLSAANPFFITYNAFNRSIPLSFNITANQTRRDQDTSIEVMPCVYNIGRTAQFGFSMPKNDTATVTFYFTPNY